MGYLGKQTACRLTTERKKKVEKERMLESVSCVLITLDIRNASNTASWSMIRRRKCEVGLSAAIRRILEGPLNRWPVLKYRERTIQMTTVVPHGVRG